MTRLEELENLVQAQSLQIEKLQHDLQDYQKIQSYAHWLEEQLKLNKQRLYGRSSEVTEGLQLALFDEAECEPLPNIPADALDEKIRSRIIEKLDSLAKENKIDFIYKRQGCFFTFSYHNHKW